ncbi:MAG: hypothetical protein ABIL58_19180 [Pseudomonadota bacterium]
MTLQEQLDAYKKGFQAKAPAEVQAIMHEATTTLATSGIMDRAIAVGAATPAFTLKSTDGKTLSLAGLLAKGPVVLTFYRGKW